MKQNINLKVHLNYELFILLETQIILQLNVLVRIFPNFIILNFIIPGLIYSMAWIVLVLA